MECGSYTYPELTPIKTFKSVESMRGHTTTSVKSADDPGCRDEGCTAGVRLRPRRFRRSLRLIGELLPADGGLHHYPADGTHHHRDAVDEGGIGGDPGLQHDGRGICRKRDLARLEAVQGVLIREHEQLAEGLGPGLRAHRPLG